MSLVTLSGTVSAADLNTNFGDKTSALTTAATANLGGKINDWHVHFRAGAITSASAVSALETLFILPDDMELMTMGLSFWNPDATSRTITATLTAYDLTSASSVSKYLLDRTVSVSVTGATDAQHTATRTDYGSTSTAGRIFLVKGITYRILLASNHAGAIEQAYGFVHLRPRRRRA